MVSIVMEKVIAYNTVSITVVLLDMNQMDLEDVSQSLNLHKFHLLNQVLLIIYVLKDKHSSKDFVFHNMLHHQAVHQDSSQTVQDLAQHTHLQFLL